MRDDPTIVRLELGLPPAADVERAIASVGEFAAARGVDLDARADASEGAELPQGRVDEHAEARLASLLASVVRRKTGVVAASFGGTAADRVVRSRDTAGGCSGRCVWRADLVALIVCVVVMAAATAMIAFPAPPR